MRWLHEALPDVVRYTFRGVDLSTAHLPRHLREEFWVQGVVADRRTGGEHYSTVHYSPA